MLFLSHLLFGQFLKLEGLTEDDKKDKEKNRIMDMDNNPDLKRILLELQIILFDRGQ
ncbi:hypothetical protein D3C75_1130070 [compost metagenome]